MIAITVISIENIINLDSHLSTELWDREVMKDKISEVNQNKDMF